MKKLKLIYISLFVLFFNSSCNDNELANSEIENRENNTIKETSLKSTQTSNEIRIGAWYTTSPEQINALEEIGVNLFYLNHYNYHNMSVNDRTTFIQSCINVLNESSMIVLPIDNFIGVNWFSSEGMGAFVENWSQNNKVYGFLLRDDILTAPYPTDCTSNECINQSAPYIFRWYYRMIKNLAKDEDGSPDNGYQQDISRGKKIIVTLPFYPTAQNNIPGYSDKSFATCFSDVPPNFLIPGDAWDIIMPYYYPHRQNISLENEKFNMNNIFQSINETFGNDLTSVIPIIQTVSEANGNPNEDFPLEFQPDLSIQYESLFNHGLLTSKSYVFYSVNGHVEVTDNLLHINNNHNEINTNPNENLYYREANNLNIEHLRRFN